jgi:putative transposase
LESVLKAGGKVEMSELLRMRVRYFSDGMVLGSREYLNGFYERQREYFPEKRKAVFAKPKGADWGGLEVVRNLKVKVFGLGWIESLGNCSKSDGKPEFL